jgi:hypothetical protein
MEVEIHKVFINKIEKRPSSLTGKDKVDFKKKLY